MYKAAIIFASSMAICFSSMCIDFCSIINKLMNSLNLVEIFWSLDMASFKFFSTRKQYSSYTAKSCIPKQIASEKLTLHIFPFFGFLLDEIF